MATRYNQASEDDVHGQEMFKAMIQSPNHQVKNLSIRETAEATGYSPSQVCRIQASHRDNSVSKINKQ